MTCNFFCTYPYNKAFVLVAKRRMEQEIIYWYEYEMLFCIEKILTKGIPLTLKYIKNARVALVRLLKETRADISTTEPVH